MNLINRMYVLISILLATFFTLDPAYAQEELFNSVAKLMDPAAMEEAQNRKFVNRFQEKYAVESVQRRVYV